LKLLADSGSTKTDWRTITPDGSVGQARTVGFNPYYQNTETIAAELLTNLKPQVPGPVREIHFYGAGVTGPEKAEVLTAALRQTFPEAETVDVQSDLLGAARALCGRAAGIACILGTGSNTCFAEGGEIVRQVPTLGFWLGDEGSGSYLGRIFVPKYLRGELPDDLRERFAKRFPECTRENVLERAYRREYPNRYFAGFSKFLFDHRRHPFVYRFLYDAFALFFQTYVERYPEHRQVPVHFTGSVAFYYADFLRQLANDRGITLGYILETPIAGLTLYHQS
jgi:N-acetylglucosamine kinase-like BadF-type ATPase